MKKNNTKFVVIVTFLSLLVIGSVLWKLSTPDEIKRFTIAEQSKIQQYIADKFTESCEKCQINGFSPIEKVGKKYVITIYFNENQQRIFPLTNSQVHRILNK